MEAGHVRLDHVRDQPRRDTGVDGIATGLEDHETGVGRKIVTRGDHVAGPHDRGTKRRRDGARGVHGGLLFDSSASGRSDSAVTIRPARESALLFPSNADGVRLAAGVRPACHHAGL